jgi:hypothetical protein
MTSHATRARESSTCEPADADPCATTQRCHGCDLAECECCSDEPDEDEQDNTCRACAGTGIGHGDPDTSRCGQCGGRGYHRAECDPDENYERMCEDREFWADVRRFEPCDDGDYGDGVEVFCTGARRP